MMKPSSLFGVFIRAVGFLILAYALWQIIVAVVMAVVLPEPALTGPSVHIWPWTHIMLQVLAVLFGALCFFRADCIVRLAYGSDSAEV